MTAEETPVDKSTWPPGPWHDEPDYEHWITEVGLDGLIVRNGFGVLCGYVGLPENHPYHHKPYQELLHLDVHGALTYSNHCQGHICHLPLAGRPDHIWWLGFDCGHAFDYAPAMDARMKKIAPALAANLAERQTYKPITFVRQEVENLARQLCLP